MKPGDILRQRKVRTYFTGSETQRYLEYAEYAANQERIKVNQKVFVSLMLGMEPLAAERGVARAPNSPTCRPDW